MWYVVCDMAHRDQLQMHELVTNNLEEENKSAVCTRQLFPTTSRVSPSSFCLKKTPQTRFQSIETASSQWILAKPHIQFLHQSYFHILVFYF